jgi:uncharacterized membrane protein
MTERNSSILIAAKATLVGGAVFLIPGFLAAFVLAKVFGILKSLAVAIGPRLGIESLVGGVLLDVAVIIAVLLVCLAAGLFARRATAQRIRTKLDHLLLASFPGYAFVKGLAENMQQSEEIASSFVPVLVTFDDFWQVAFETDRASGGTVAVYLPGAPNPWSGSVIFVSGERVEKLPVSVTEAIKIIRTLGRGSEAIAAALPRRAPDVPHELSTGRASA